jgi:NAD(P)-dependent dehydrogenase (short-subunit alcohol dehydrogenase family)
MDKFSLSEIFGIAGKVTVVTGGAGILCSVISQALADMNVKVAILDLNLDAAQQQASRIVASGGFAIGLGCNVLDTESLRAAFASVRQEMGQIDFLINGAGGNKAQASTNQEHGFFDLLPEALREVVDLNLLGTILPCQVFGKTMAEQKSGVILNIASLNAIRPLTRIPAYSAAKAGVSNFTQWLAVHMAMEYSANIRVNAIAPGFFITDQNRFLLTNKSDQSLTDRGQSVIHHTPMGRFGQPGDLVGTVVWLLSPASSFVTGVVVPVDGGFSAFSGV